MSYDYLIVRVKNPPISSFREFTQDQEDNWGHTEEKVKQMLSTLYPSAEWRTEEVKYEIGIVSELWTEIFDMEGRFELKIGSWPCGRIIINGSHHVNQTKEVKKICKCLNLTAFDIQTGECIYLQGE